MAPSARHPQPLAFRNPDRSCCPTPGPSSATQTILPTATGILQMELGAGSGVGAWRQAHLSRPARPSSLVLFAAVAFVVVVILLIVVIPVLGQNPLLHGTCGRDTRDLLDFCSNPLSSCCYKCPSLQGLWPLDETKSRESPMPFPTMPLRDAPSSSPLFERSTSGAASSAFSRARGLLSRRNAHRNCMDFVRRGAGVLCQGRPSKTAGQGPYTKVHAAA